MNCPRLLFIEIFSVVLLLSETNVMCQKVHTNVGTFIGFTDDVNFNGTTKRVVKHLGIPYGETTAGENRFSKPIPKLPLQGEYLANRTDGRAICVQSGVKEEHMSEDCLYLDIYAPYDTLTPTFKKHPVMIWIHGGSFISGSSSDYNGDVLSSFYDVVVVIINYRLNVFGFLTTGDQFATGNFGLWDQHLAIKWVHEHITEFGGNPDQVTLFGQSAGSASVLCQAMFPDNKGYFNRVIAESGSPTMPFIAVSLPQISPLAEYVGCNGLHSKETVSCLRSKSWKTLEKAARDLTINNFSPVVDGEFFKRLPQELFLNPYCKEMNFYSSLDIIFGVNDLESATLLTSIYGLVLDTNNSRNLTVSRKQFEDSILPLYLPLFNPNLAIPWSVLEAIALTYSDWKEPNSPETTREMLVDLTTDLIFNIPAVTSADAHAYSASRTGSGGSTYFYQYSFLSEKFEDRPAWMKKGACHGDEMAAVFGFPNLNTSSYRPSDVDVTVSAVVMSHWTKFAKTGNPNLPPQAQVWPTYSADARVYLKFTSEVTSLAAPRKAFGEPRTSFWLKVLPTLMRCSSDDYPRLQIDKEQKPFSERFNINGNSAENVIMGLAAVSCLLLVCLTVTCAIVLRKQSRKNENV